MFDFLKSFFNDFLYLFSNHYKIKVMISIFNKFMEYFYIGVKGVRVLFKM